jgi:hypothetical protein
MWPGTVAQVCNHSYLRWRSGGSWFRRAWAKKQRDYIGKIMNTEKAGGMTNVADHLPNKCKALSSISQYCQNRKKIKCDIIFLEITAN